MFLLLFLKPLENEIFAKKEYLSYTRKNKKVRMKKNKIK